MVQASEIRARLNQKIEMESNQPDGADMGDVYYRNGISMVEQLCQQLLNFQLWCKDNTCKPQENAPVQSAEGKVLTGSLPSTLKTPVFQLEVWHLIVLLGSMGVILLSVLGVLPPLSTVFKSLITKN